LHGYMQVGMHVGIRVEMAEILPPAAAVAFSQQSAAERAPSGVGNSYCSHTFLPMSKTGKARYQCGQQAGRDRVGENEIVRRSVEVGPCDDIGTGPIQSSSPLRPAIGHEEGCKLRGLVGTD